MTLTQLIAYADTVKPNAFDTATKTIWINEIEGMVQTDVMLIASDDIVQYDAEDIEETLLVEPPHDKLYRTYLCAMIDFNHAEYDRFNNAMLLFNRQYSEYMEWYTRTYSPADQ